MIEPQEGGRHGLPARQLGLQIKAHWKKYRPQMYTELEKSGHLLESVYEAKERTSDLMDSLLDKGLPYHQAWELVREEWVFLPDEEDQPNLGEDPLEL